MRTNRILGGAGLVLAACVLPACSTTPRPTAAELKEGLNLLDVRDPSWGMNAAYVKAGRVVYLESRVGPLKPEVYRLDAPNEPQNEMDYRFIDQENHTFVAVRGGDSWIDPSWGADIAATKLEKVDYAKRESDFALAAEAATAFNTGAPVAFADHAFHMRNFALQPLPSADTKLIAANQQILKSPPPARSGETGYGSYNSGTYSTFWVAKYSGTTGCVFGLCAASHSATDMWSCDWNGSGCSWVRRISANNHGRDFTQLSYDCYSQGDWQLNGIDGSTASGATGSYDGQGGCQTSYSWSSSNNHHLCNDDAAYELWEAKYGPQDNINFAVYDSSWCRGSACGSSPSTFSCNYPDGDWNTPNCP